jgi:hypothetical protein
LPDPIVLWRFHGARHDLRGLVFLTSFGYGFGLELAAQPIWFQLQPSLERLVDFANGLQSALLADGFAAIDLKFHDLRREAGSSFLEHGMPPHYVQAFLDHANLSTTSRYLNITAQGMHAALKRVEDERGIRCTPVALAADRREVARPTDPAKPRQ